MQRILSCDSLPADRVMGSLLNAYNVVRLSVPHLDAEALRT